ncbi:ribosome silencing factor [Nakamurella sp. A5-74]|uniref:Ribosomal silencing factor RsfS n=1 Tax=Nakamurella sp. A5-74 TaxID=3158264 RepID=A0AAU8DV83_9ACTN
MTATDLAIELARTAATAASDKLATDIAIVDVSDKLAITDCFVLATGSNERQISAIVDAVEDKLRAAGHKPVRREGERDGRWVLIDFVEIVVHVQHAEERVFYGLDRLWKDCPSIPFDDQDSDRSAELRAAAPGANEDVPAENADRPDEA